MRGRRKPAGPPVPHINAVEVPVPVRPVAGAADSTAAKAKGTAREPPEKGNHGGVRGYRHIKGAAPPTRIIKNIKNRRTVHYPPRDPCYYIYPKINFLWVWGGQKIINYSILNNN